jgi:hypothetical protein
MSGDMNTSLGNGFSNLMLWKFMCFKSKIKSEGFVEGDDGIFAISGSKLPDLSIAKRLGFALKLQTFDDPSKASFCGNVYADNILREPHDFLANFGWSSSCIGAGVKVRRQLLRAKALSAKYETPHCPIVGALADRALVLTRGIAPRFVNDGYHEIPSDVRNVPQFNPTWRDRELFAELYGITPNQQMRVEQAIMAGETSLTHLLEAPEPYLRYWDYYVQIG